MESEKSKMESVDGKEYTYYHFTHSGDIETDRTPDMRRMERMPFPRPMIDNSNSKSLKSMAKQKRN